MNRRDHLKMLMILPCALRVPTTAEQKPPIQLHVDLEVDPARESEMIGNYRRIFRPAISTQPGFLDVQLLKLRKALAGAPPADSTYRLLISFQTEEQRQKWIATETHQHVWPTIEKTLKGAKYTALLYDIA